MNEKKVNNLLKVMKLTNKIVLDKLNGDIKELERLRKEIEKEVQKGDY